ncbi:hypothetical protein CPC08DRAFT_708965 [Agrocybe pediades]|nr:hypothetical protein CPC08DRAFT_708965 [Agrocybe pediades]
MNVELSPLSSWIVQLRHLTLSTPLSWTKTLTALENMKQLESLRIQTNPYDEEKSLPIPTPRHINLPCLRMLSLDGPLGDVMQVLSSIGGVSEECGLFLKLSGLTASTITSVEDSLGSCVSSFQHFCRVYAKESGPKSLFLWIDRHNVLFYDREDVVPSLGYRAEASSSESIVPLLPFLSRTIMTYPIMHTTHLELILHLPSDSIPEELLKFLLAFVSLDTMKITDMATLRAISGLQREHNNLFPSLSTIKFDIWDKMNVPLIQEYLDQRRSIGALVKCLDLTSFTGSLYSVGDLTALEQFPGMRIIWPDEEKAADDDFICRVYCVLHKTYKFMTSKA